MSSINAINNAASLLYGQAFQIIVSQKLDHENPNWAGLVLERKFHDEMADSADQLWSIAQCMGRKKAMYDVQELELQVLKRQVARFEFDRDFEMTRVGSQNFNDWGGL